MGRKIYEYRGVAVERTGGSFAGFSASVSLPLDAHWTRQFLTTRMADTFGGIIESIDEMLGLDGAYEVPTCAECECLLIEDAILCSECEEWQDEQEATYGTDWRE